LLLFFVSLQKEFANAKKTAFYYHKLGRTKDLRQAAYVELFKAHVDDIDLKYAMPGKLARHWGMIIFVEKLKVS
jgi:hypothetical protein